MSNRNHKTIIDSVAEDNSTILRKLLFFTVLMFSFSYALVPMYEKICEVTGIRQPVADIDAVIMEARAVDLTREIFIELDANVHSAALQFKPVQSSIKTHLGEFAEIVYEVRNNSKLPITGQAIPSYSPRNLEKYLKKIECFCFTKQDLEPGEIRQMPVKFSVDPQLPADINTVTISYTFYRLESDI
ncbi:cytochrome c oxidase assembly protein subunit 11 [Nitrosomonas marina]|uniref:Cytochrome c oxidase assembly protein CtaG n=1 Tax=Nitrosomonas marina TaxID=917 RepID=A0A1H8GQY9_9PROT|nr:cytochrome c oxidase assembly protein subunit 11 [Nitrosomonas marina]